MRVEVSKAAELLGYSGLLPQLIAVLAVLYDGEYAEFAVAFGLIYASLIFSFLGGVWWGQAISAKEVSARIYVTAVMPSLLAFGGVIAAIIIWDELAYGALIIGQMIALSPLVDRRLSYATEDFMRLRWHLSLGLGALTTILGFIALP